MPEAEVLTKALRPVWYCEIVKTPRCPSCEAANPEGLDHCPACGDAAPPQERTYTEELT